MNKIKTQRVVVTGLGMISALGLDFETSWKALLNAQSGVKTITAFDPSELPVHIAACVSNFTPYEGLDPKEANRLSRFIQFGVRAAGEALKHSGLPFNAASENDRNRWGTSFGVGIGDIGGIVDTAMTLRDKGAKRVSPFFIPHVIVNMASGVIANTFGLRGPNLCTATACTSSAHSIGEAWLYISQGFSDVMVAGGSEAAICPISIAGFANMKALSRNHGQPEKASRPFDLKRDGFVMGEGAAALVLESLEHAQKRNAKILAEIVGYGMSGDAFHMTSPPPEGEGAQRCMKQALAIAGINSEDVDYINAHGTSTYYNDLYESQAIAKVFPHAHSGLAVSSTKGATGHCLGAAGAIEAAFTSQALYEGILPPTINYENPDPECTLDYVPNTPRKMKPRYALSNSFGFGGTNASLVFKNWENPS